MERLSVFSVSVSSNFLDCLKKEEVLRVFLVKHCFSLDHNPLINPWFFHTWALKYLGGFIWKDSSFED